jgi:acetylglutamate kinase
MRVLIKLGGTLLEAEGSRRRLAREISGARQEGAEITVVHGGGKQLTTYLKERGVESRFVNGLRVTSAEVLDSVIKVVAGSVNQYLVSAFIAEGAEAVGLTGADAMLTEAEPLNPDLGFVGKPVRSNGRLLRVLTAEGYLPVVACVAGDRDGALYNVNADQMAVACAIGFGAEKLFFFTDVDGVLDGEGGLCERLDEAGCRRLIETGAATGGMRAKLEAALTAVRGGVGEVVIAGGTREGLAQALLRGERIGTKIVA